VRGPRESIRALRARAEAARRRIPGAGAERPGSSRVRLLLPTLFTLANLTCGFLSIFFVMEDQFHHERTAIVTAAVLILVGIVFDLLDGMVARLTHGTSEFGVQLDSLADLVTAGVAPAVLTYATFLRDSGGAVMIVPALWFALAVALRLARFNVSTGTADPRYFTGLASPGGAGFLASFAICHYGLQTAGKGVLFDALRWMTDGAGALMPYLTFGVGLLMVSTFPYRSLKQVHIAGLNPRLLMVAIVVGVLTLVLWPPLIFPLFAAYALSGVTMYVVRRARRVG